MGEPADIQGYSAHELTPIGSHSSMLQCPLVYRYLPKDPAISRNLRLHTPQVSSLYPDSNLPSNAPTKTAIQVPQEPTSNLSLQMSQNPLMHPGIPMQSRFQNHLSSVSQLDFQGSPFPPGTPMQSSLQWHSYPERSLGPQLSPRLSMISSIPMQPDISTQETVSVYPNDQKPSSSFVSSGCKGSLGLMVPSDKYGDQEVRPKAKKIQRKERTVYSEEQKLLLQKYFDQNSYPSPEQYEELAQKINVTKCEIQTWFKNKRAKHKQMNLKKVEKELLESSGSSKDVSVSTHSSQEPKSPGTSTMAFKSKLNPSLEASLHDDQDIKDAGCIPQEDSLEVAAPDPGQPTVVEGQPDPAMAEGPASVKSPVPTTAGAPDLGLLILGEVQTGSSVAEEPASVEAPVPTTAAAQGPDDTQYMCLSSDQLWQWIIEDLDSWKDSQSQLHPEFKQ